LFAAQGPIGLITAVLAFMWWTERAARERLQRDYFEHLSNDISEAREIRA